MIDIHKGYRFYWNDKLSKHGLEPWSRFMWEWNGRVYIEPHTHICCKEHNDTIKLDYVKWMKHNRL